MEHTSSSAYRTPFSTVKSVHGIDCSPPNHAEVKNAYYVSTSPYACIAYSLIIDGDNILV